MPYMVALNIKLVFSVILTHSQCLNTLAYWHSVCVIRSYDSDSVLCVIVNAFKHYIYYFVSVVGVFCSYRYSCEAF